MCVPGVTQPYLSGFTSELTGYPLARSIDHRRGRHTLCATFRATRIDPGGFAEYIRVPAENARLDVLEIPDGMSDATATLIEPLACILRGQRWAGVVPGSRVAVIGAGSMGLLEIFAATEATT